MVIPIPILKVNLLLYITRGLIGFVVRRCLYLA